MLLPFQIIDNGSVECFTRKYNQIYQQHNVFATYCQVGPWEWIIMYRYYAGQKAWHLARRQLVVTIFGCLCIYIIKNYFLHGLVPRFKSLLDWSLTLFLLWYITYSKTKYLIIWERQFQRVKSRLWTYG